MTNLRLRAGGGPAGATADLIDGLGQLPFLRDLKARLDLSPDSVLRDLDMLRACLLDVSGWR